MSAHAMKSSGTSRPAHRHLLIPVLLVLAAGCAGVPREQIEIQRHSIEPPAAPASADSARHVSLRVDSFLSAAEQRADRIVYKKGNLRRDYYYYHRWIAPPGSMLGEALGKYLLDWGYCPVVRDEDVGVIPTHELQGRLVTLYADNRKKEKSARLEVAVTLLSIAPDRLEREIVFQRNYSYTIPRRDTRIQSFLEATQVATSQWLDSLRTDLEPILRSEEERRRRGEIAP